MKKRMHWTMLAVLGLFSPAAVLALGLGGAVVESYLGQPLDVRVELISQNEDELQSITANLASAADFELLGLSLTAITVPLEFEVVTDADKPYVHITSQLNVNEPVVQVLVEVVWASGRMLREYTLFLDPPTIDSPAPPVALSPAPAKTPPLETSAAPVTPIQKNVPPREEKAETPAPGAAEPVADLEPSVEPAADESFAAEAMEQEQEQQLTVEQNTGEDVYGPVARGETLWGIAREYSRGSGYSINQAMLALQRRNPEAFIKGNINSLKRGAILRLPAYSELAELTSKEALLEVQRQEEELRTGVRAATPDFGTPTVADSGDYQSTASEPEADSVVIEDRGHLEIVPPAEDDAVDTQAAGQAPEQDTGEIESLQEELSRTEEELLNAKQENTYLAERIRELEAEAASREAQPVEVEDAGLAGMESSLAEERASVQSEPPLAITPGGEKEAWFAGSTPWFVGIAIVLIGLVTWVLRRRSAGVLVVAGDAEAQDMTDAEVDFQRAVESEASERATIVQPAPTPESAIEPEPVSEPEREEPGPFVDLEEGEGPTVVLRHDEMDIEPETGSEIYFEDQEEEPEEDTVAGENDPEIKLDLARAYLSLGDKEASRSMLDEVLKNGNEAQKAEARQMLDEL